MVIKNITLVKIAAVGGFLTISMGYALQWKVNDNIRKTEPYVEAMKLLRTHTPAVYLLGEPIKEKLMDVGNEEKNYVTRLSAHYEVPVRGPKDKGTLYVWANRKTEIEPWIVERLELGVKSEPNRRLLIKAVE